MTERSVCANAACDNEPSGTRRFCPTCRGRLRRYGDPTISAPGGWLGTCAVCSHPDRDLIERIMRKGRVPLKRFGLSAGQSSYHRRHHLDNEAHAERLAVHNLRRLEAVRAGVAHSRPPAPDPAVVAELVSRSRAASGVPPTATDPVALARIAAVFRQVARTG